jgi:hypothetical protein
MKIVKKGDEPTFVPITLYITIESKEEQETLLSLFKTITSHELTTIALKNTKEHLNQKVISTFIGGFYNSLLDK